MKPDDVQKINDKSADMYDESVGEHRYHPEFISGLCYEYIKQGDRLLDIGIGTGLASINFARMGLRVHGIDHSEKMMDLCRSKGFADELKVHDLNDIPFPYPDRYFDHVITSGVLQFFGELDPIFKEVARMIKPDGIFAFVLREQAVTEGVGEEDLRPDSYVSHMTHYGIRAFMHGDEYIRNLMRSNGITGLKELRFLLWSGLEGLSDFNFKAYIARKSQ